MDVIKIAARPRSGRGSAAARRARAAGWVPAVCYGHGIEAQALEVSARDLGRLDRAKKLTHLVDLGISGETGQTLAVIKELQRDVIRREVFLHVDFQRVALDEKITVQVPFEVTGVPVGVKEEGGILEHPLRFLTIRCLPTDIPEKVTVDVSGLKLGHSIHVRDIHVEKAEIVNSPDEVVALVSVPAKEEAAMAAAPVGTEAAAAPSAEGATAPAAAGTAAEGASTSGGAADAKASASKDKDQKKPARDSK